MGYMLWEGRSFDQCVVAQVHPGSMCFGSVRFGMRPKRYGSVRFGTILQESIVEPPMAMSGTILNDKRDLCVV